MTSGADIKVEDYGAFPDAVSTIKDLNSQVEESKQAIQESITKIDSDAVFAGPICESVKGGFTKVSNQVMEISDNFSVIGSELTKISQNYNKADTSAQNQIFMIKDNKVQVVDATSVAALEATAYSVDIPDDLGQRPYLITGYSGRGFEYTNGGYAKAEGTAAHKAVHDMYVADGARYKNGIAVINVNGQDRYLVATSETFGKVGDSINVKLKNGQEVPCIIADAKSKNDSNYNIYGHAEHTGGTGDVNILEFEVDINKYKSSGNPTTKGWGLEWDSNSRVASIDNKGSVI